MESIEKTYKSLRCYLSMNLVRNLRKYERKDSGILMTTFQCFRAMSMTIWLDVYCPCTSPSINQEIAVILTNMSHVGICLHKLNVWSKA